MAKYVEMGRIVRRITKAWRPTVALVAFLLVLIGCGQVEPSATRPFVGPDELFEELDHPLVLPLGTWDKSMLPSYVRYGAHGLIIFGVERSTDKADAIITHDGEHAWVVTRLNSPNRPLGIDMTDRSFIVARGQALEESVDGVSWQTAIPEAFTLAEPNAIEDIDTQIWNAGGQTFIEYRADSKVLATWTSGDVGKWERVEQDGLLRPRVDLNGESLIPTRAFPGRTDNEVLLSMRQEKSNPKGPAVAFSEGTTWALHHPFAVWAEPTIVDRVAHIFWNRSAAEYVAIGLPAFDVNDHWIYVGRSQTLEQWTVERVQGPGISLGFFFDDGARVFYANLDKSESTYYTDSFSAWFELEEAARFSPMLSLGDGLCLGDWASRNNLALLLASGPCLPTEAAAGTAK